MQFTVNIPDDLASRIIPSCADPARIALEDMAVEAYRAHRLTEHQLAALLGLSRYDLDGFLKQRDVFHEYSPADLQQELETGQRLWQKRKQALDKPSN